MRMIRFGLAQLNATVGDFAGNVAKFTEALKQGREKAADLIIFPELFLAGYPPEDLLLKKYFLEENISALNIAAEKSIGIQALVGFVHPCRGKIYNAAAWLGQGKIMDIYHKMKLPNYGVFDERRYFTPGRSLVAAALGEAICGITICEDIWISPGPAEYILKKSRAKILLNLSASPFHRGKYGQREKLITDLARRNQAWVIYVNLVGGQDELLFDGGSLAANPSGEIVLRARQCEEEILWLDVPQQSLVPQVNQPIKGFKLISGASPDRAVRPAIQVSLAAPAGEAEEIYKALVLCTHDYVIKNGFQNVVIGLSGGIDSSLTAAIAVAALGFEHVMGVSMPSRFTSAGTRDDAEKLAENLKIKLHTVPIEPVLEAFLTALETPMRARPDGLAHQNLQARIRGSLLMAFSNRYGSMVLATSNKSEAAAGYATLYGDMVGGFSVIKDLLKRDVYRISEFINQAAGFDLIPRSVIERAPSAELKENQKDQDDLPEYDILDQIVDAYVEKDRGVEDILTLGFDKDVAYDVIRRIDRNEYKRRQAAPGVKITPKAFGKDRRVPMTVRFRPVKDKN